jgi:hypothetical protein
MNKPARIVQFVLLALVAAGIGAWAWRSFGPQSAPGAAAAAEGGAEPGAAAVPEPSGCVLVTYFTSDQRCPTCLKIEKLTREAVEQGFAGELAGGQLRFRTVNFDRPEHRHYAKDYGLAFKTVVVSDRRGGGEAKWEKFDKVWDLVDEPDAFAAYLREGVRRFLSASPDA